MSNKLWAAGLLAAAAWALAAVPARAENAFRVTGETVPASGLTGGARTVTLEMTGDDAETVDVWGRRGGWGGGYGYRGGWGGGYGYRGWGGGWGGYGYRGWGGYGYRPYYYARSWYGYPSYYAYNFYQPYYVYYPVPYYYSPFYDYPINIGAPANGTDGYAQPPAQREPFAAPRDSNYPYDGGPQNPVPLPKPDDRPAPMQVQGKVISASANSPSKFAYPAYGETPARPTGFAVGR